MDEVEERPGIRMQIDVIAHDATARGSHTKLRRTARERIADGAKWMKNLVAENAARL